MKLLRECADLLESVRARCPLVHHLTNYVTVNDCANITLAIGGSPIMATAIEEVEEIARISSSVVINIGTLNAATVASMLAAGKTANQKGIPVVFDPVGAGASRFRSETTFRIMSEIDVAVLRGNISEICATGGMDSHTKGVDADNRDMDMNAERIAADLARAKDCTVVITGATDAISDGKKTIRVMNGHPMLSKVSGTGCMCTSLVGAFVGAEPANPVLAASAALLCMGIAGEIAFNKAGGGGLGSFRHAIVDAVSLMDAKTILALGKADENEN